MGTVPNMGTNVVSAQRPAPSADSAYVAASWRGVVPLSVLSTGVSVVHGMVAAMEPTVRDAVLDAGRTLGLPERVSEAFIRLLRPCIYFCPFDELPEELRKGARPAARAAGFPHLPRDMDVPPGLPHVLTIDCAAIPAGVLDIDFPVDGHLIVLADITDYPGGGVVIHLPTGTETAERRREVDEIKERGAAAFHEPFSLYAVPGITDPAFLSRSHVAEAVDYVGDDAERADLVEELIDEIREVLIDRWDHGIQLGGYSGAWQNPVEDRGNVLLIHIAENAVCGGDGHITLISGTQEQIAKRRFDELDFDVEC